MGTYVKVKGQFATVELVLDFHHVDSRVQIHVSGLVASTLIHWVVSKISVALIKTIIKNNLSGEGFILSYNSQVILRH